MVFRLLSNLLLCSLLSCILQSILIASLLLSVLLSSFYISPPFYWFLLSLLLFLQLFRSPPHLLSSFALVSSLLSGLLISTLISFCLLLSSCSPFCSPLLLTGHLSTCPSFSSLLCPSFSFPLLLSGVVCHLFFSVLFAPPLFWSLLIFSPPSISPLPFLSLLSFCRFAGFPLLYPPVLPCPRSSLPPSPLFSAYGDGGQGSWRICPLRSH